MPVLSWCCTCLLRLLNHNWLFPTVSCATEVIAEVPAVFPEYLSIHTLLKRKCSHHLTDCSRSLICLEKECKMFIDNFKKLPNTVCRWKKIDQNSHYIKGSSDKIANVARVPDDIVTIIFEDPFWSHIKRLIQWFRWEPQPSFTSWIPEPKLVEVPMQQHYVMREMSLCLCLMCQMITVLWDAMSWQAGRNSA